MIVASVLQRRLDTPGQDVCRLEESRAGWKPDGTAVFLEDRVPARLTYRVTCDPGWRTEQGQVHGWIRSQSVDFIISRKSGDSGP